MKQKIFAIFMMLLMCLSAILIMPSDLEVNATGGGGSGEGNTHFNPYYDYLWDDITTNLSNVVHKVYPSGENVIRKGRALGTIGNRWTADYIYYELKDNLSLDNVQKIQLTDLESKDTDPVYIPGLPWNCTYKVETVDFKMEINNDTFHAYPYQNPIPKNETFTMPSAVPNNYPQTPGFMSMDYKRSFTNNSIVPKDLLEIWTIDGATSSHYLNVTDDISELNIFYGVCGNTTYIDNDESLPDDQEGRLFIFNEENGCENQLDNVIDAAGVILIHNNTGSQYYADINFSIYPIQAARINKTSSNLTTVLEMLENDTIMIVNNFVDNETLTFTHNFSFLDSWWPNNDFFIVSPFRLAKIYKSTTKDDRSAWIYVQNQYMWLFGKGWCNGFILYYPKEETDDDIHLMESTKTLWRGGANTMFKQFTQYLLGKNPSIQIFSVNRSVGKWLEENATTTTVSGHFEQEDNNVIAYNVEGNITIDNSPDDAIVVISNRYDGWWGETPGDSGAGAGVVMAIAKYIKYLEENNNIKPKYNLTFLFTTGEEYLMRGSWHYSLTHPEEEYNIITWIGTDQLGFTQPEDPDPGFVYKATCKDILKRSIVKNIVQNIADKSDFKKKTGMNFNATKAKFGNANQDDVAWVPRTKCNTIAISKDDPNIGWKRHHTAGLNYEEGDSMKNMNQDELNATFNVTWNTTKFFCFNPHSWFDGTPTRTVWDSPDDNDNRDDSVNVTFTVKTSLPHDRVMVRAILYPKATIRHPFFPLLYRYETRKNYTVTSEGIEDTLTISLPKDAPKGNYILHLYLYNSSGEVVLTTFEDYDVDIDRSPAESALNVINTVLEILKKDTISFPQCIQDLIDNRDDFAEKCLKFIFPLIDNMSDILGRPLFVNDSYIPGAFYLHPPNNAPEKPETPTGPSPPVKAGTEYNFNTSTWDKDGDKIDYQWEWRANKIFPDKEGWYGPYDQNVTHEQNHTWNSPIQYIKVRVRARDQWGSPNVFSGWSDPLTYYVSINCGASVTSQSSQSQSVQSLSYPNNLIATQSGTFEGFNYGLGGTCTYKWDFDDGTNSSDQNTDHNFNEIGVYNVSLNVKNETNSSVNYSMFVNVVNLTSGFNVSSSGTKPYETIGFTDTSVGNFTITNWAWDFGDGNISYEQNSTHSYSADGDYNVKLNVTDNQSNAGSSYLIIHIESTPPRIIDISHNPYYIGINSNVTINASFFENQSGVALAKVNISYPDGSYGNFTMNMTENCTSDYHYNFSDTGQFGRYYFYIWVVDNANNSNSFTGCSFYVDHIFGYTKEGVFNKTVEDTIRGSIYTIHANGTADNLTAYIQTNTGTPPKIRCMIYKADGGSLIGTTEEKIYSTGGSPEWVVFNFTGTKPELLNGTGYVLTCWSNDSVVLHHDNASSGTPGRIRTESYDGTPPDPIYWASTEHNLYSIYCRYTTAPEITGVTANPGNIGFGYSTTISADVDDNLCGIEDLSVNVTYPDSSAGNYSMSSVGNHNYEYVVSDTWDVGQYNYTIWAVDTLGTVNSSSEQSFTVSAAATISVCTINDSYGSNESVNITDPPGGSPLIGYELLDDGEVLRIWNKYDNYYFDTGSGIQLTNHYNDYWSHNVLMLGYYNNDVWNLIYRTDELSGFNKDIDSDDETFVDATIWKNLSYEGYDFRLAVRYHLGVGDNELTVIPYIKNIDDEDIPYNLGFAWELKDIQVDMTPGGDYIDVNQTMYYLNQTLDNVYTDLSEPEFYLMENITDMCTKSLYLKWNQSLNYKLQVKSRGGQYNAPVTLFVKIGTLAVDQEKYTEMYWYDAEQITYYFNDYDMGEAWATTPGFMVDGSTLNKAFTTITGDVELCDGNNCSGSDLGTISWVEIRVSCYYTGDSRDTILRPVFGGTSDGWDYPYHTSPGLVWSPWFVITYDPSAPQSWGWSDIENLDCDVEAEYDIMGGAFTLYCGKVEVRVTYTPWTPPVVSAPYPSDGSTGISIAPVLNITVSDPDGDSMDITWLSNSSGSWQVFGTNSSVGNGTYHQTLSNASVNGQWWYWKVNVSDGSNITESSVYKFYTGCQSKITNTGSTDIKGYLLMQVQYYNTSNSTWVVADDTVNESTPRTMFWEDPGGTPGQHIFGLDTIFNGLVNTNNLIGFGNGTYRIYVAFRDPNGNVLVCNDSTEMIATYEFTVTFD